MTKPARDQILHAIRENLAASVPRDTMAHALHSPPPLTAPIPGPQSPDLVERFTTQLEGVGAQWTLVRGEAEAARALRRILSDTQARRVAGSDAPLVRRLLPESLASPSRDELFACDAGVTTAQWGIAETGTLVLESACERSRLVSLVPPMHVALLSTARLCPSLSDALARVDRASHAITLITGPSRTSDIELTLVVGVHGPQTVHVLLLEEEER
ncbi:MAG TPA: lactate utilization protein [Gemmatimonadales bacterium]|nr:lactate utilization protein [Gemmatimonadales bacterium]